MESLTGRGKQKRPPMLSPAQQERAALGASTPEDPIDAQIVSELQEDATRLILVTVRQVSERTRGAAADWSEKGKAISESAAVKSLVRRQMSCVVWLPDPLKLGIVVAAKAL